MNRIVTSNTAMRQLIWLCIFFLHFFNIVYQEKYRYNTSFHIRSLQALIPGELIFFCQDYIFLTMKIDNKINKCWILLINYQFVLISPSLTPRMRKISKITRRNDEMPVLKG